MIVQRASTMKADLKRMRAELESVLVKRGLRSTSQRRLIIDRLFEIGGHFTADALIDDVRRADASIGAATVYRTLRLLVESGLLQEHRFAENGGVRFELHVSDEHHDHIMCLTCGKIREFEEPLIEQLQARVAEQFSFTLESHTHQLYGRCDECTAAKSQSSKD